MPYNAILAKRSLEIWASLSGKQLQVLDGSHGVVQSLKGSLYASIQVGAGFSLVILLDKAMASQLACSMFACEQVEPSQLDDAVKEFVNVLGAVIPELISIPAEHGVPRVVPCTQLVGYEGEIVAECILCNEENQTIKIKILESIA